MGGWHRLAADSRHWNLTQMTGRDMPLKAARFDVAISGASFAGLALACALSDALGPEFKVALIDRIANVADRPDARAFALSAASKHLLEAIGVWGAIAEHAQPVTGIDITDSSLEAGVRPVLLTYDNTTGAGEPATYIVPVGPLTAALRAKARDVPFHHHAGAGGGDGPRRR